MVRKILPLLIALLTLAMLPARAQSPDLADLAYGPDALQRLDVYLPDNAREAPIIVMLHGGAWAFGDKRSRSVWHPKARHWTARGAIFVSINTRLLPTGPLEQANNAAAALAYIQKSAPRWGGNSDQLVLMGHSAGAHIVALLSADRARAKAAGARPWRGTIALDTAGFDIEARMRDTPGRLYRRAFGSDPAYWRATSPQAQIAPGAIPVLAVCSSTRRVACPSARAFAAAMAKNGTPANVLPIAKSHREINVSLGDDSRYTQAVDAWIAGLGIRFPDDR